MVRLGVQVRLFRDYVRLFNHLLLVGYPVTNGGKPLLHLELDHCNLDHQPESDLGTRSSYFHYQPLYHLHLGETSLRLRGNSPDIERTKGCQGDTLRIVGATLIFIYLTYLIFL